MTPKIGSLKQEPLSFAHDFMNHKFGKGVAFRHCSLSFISLAALLYGVWLLPSPPNANVSRGQGTLARHFLTIPEVNHITSAQLYWTKLSQTSPELRGRTLTPFFNEECQRILGPQFWLFSYARANKWHLPLGYTCKSLWGSMENLEWTIFICYETLVSPCSWNEGPVPVSLVPGPGALSAGEQWPERESRWRMWLGGGWDPGSVCLYFKSAPPLSLGIG